MPDFDKVFRGVSPHFHEVLRQVEECAQSPEDIAYNALGSLIKYARKKGAPTGIVVLMRSHSYIAKLAQEPLLNATVSAAEVSDTLQKILQDGIYGIQDKRVIGIIESVQNQLQVAYERHNIRSSDASSIIRMFLEQIWKVEVHAAVKNHLGEVGLETLDRIEPIVLKDIRHIAEQIVRRPGMKRIHRPRRKNREEISISMNLLEIAGCTNEHT